MTDSNNDDAENSGHAAPGNRHEHDGSNSTKKQPKVTPSNNLPEAPTLDLPDIPRTPLKDKYEFLASIGAGGAGIIYKAKQLPIGRLVAIKMIHSHLMTPTAVKRFQQEATTVGTLSHPNIISVYDFGVSDGDQPFMVMDYIEGTALSSVLDDIGILPAQMTTSIAMQLCDGLSHAHARHILHRDLKPSNIMLVPTETGGPDLVKILDFGLAKMIYGEEEESRQEHITKTGETVGTPAFMSPEQVMGKALDRRTDIYSLGCVLYFCLTGRPPFVGKTRMETMLQQLNQEPARINRADEEPAVDPHLEEIVLKLLEKNPDNRFQTMMDVKDAIESIDAERPANLEKRENRIVPVSDTPVSVDADSEQSVSAQGPTNETSIPVSARNRDRAEPRAIFSTMTGFLFILFMLVGITVGLVFLFQNLLNSGNEEDTDWAHRRQASDAKESAAERLNRNDPHKERTFDNAAFEELLNDPHAEEASSRLHPDITDDALACLVGKEYIRRVDLSNAKNLTDNGVRHLSGLNISQLNLDNTGVGDGIRDTLLKLQDRNGRSSLQDLNLGGTRVTDELLSVLKHLPKLKELNLSKTSISDKGAPWLANLKLRELNISDTKFGDIGAKNIGAIHSLVKLDLSNTKVSKDGIRDLANLSNLEQLNLSNTKVSDEAAPILANLPKLAVLNLSNTRITARCFSSLKSSDSLGFINISKCQAISPSQAVEFEHEMEQLKAVRVQVADN